MAELTPVNPSKNQSKKPQRWKTIAILFSTIIIVAILIAFYFTYMCCLKNINNTTTLQKNSQALQQSVAQLEQKTAQLTDELKTQTEQLTALRQTQTGYTRNQWRVVEAEFLVKLANDKLQLDNNIPQALTLLESADQALRDLNDAKFLAIRKALAIDIASLQAAPKLDVPGIFMRLSAVNEQIDKLPLPNKPNPEAITSAADNEKLSWWQRGIRETGKALRQIVIVRYNPNQTPALMMPEQQGYLFLNCHALMEKASWGLLNRQVQIYQASLDQAILWIKKYFVQDAPATQSVLQNLTELKAINIQPTVPNISNSLQAFQEYFANNNERTESTTPSSTLTQ